MRKKILLLVISLAVLLVAVYVYQSYLGSSFAAIDQEDETGELDIEVGTGSIGTEPIGHANRPQWMAISDTDTGRRQAVFKAESRTERGNTHILDKFEIEIYPARGGRLHITGDKATLLITGESENIEPRQGTLSGNIVITVDVADAENIATGQSEDQQIKIHMEDMDFNYELQEIRSAGNVNITGADFALTGKGLLLQWNSAPDELRLLRLTDGGTLVYNPQERKAKPQSETAPTKADKPSESKSAEKTETPSQQRIDGYLLTIEDNVQLDSARQKISNADEVEIILALADDGEIEKLRKPSGKDKTSNKGDDKGQNPKPEVAVVSKTEPEKTDEKPEDKSVTVTWAGAVMLRPLHKDNADIELPSAGNYKISALGDNLKLINDDTEANCTRTEYYSEDNRIVLYGDENIHASIRLAGGSELVSDSIDFNDSLRKVYAFGAGSLTLGADDIGGYSKNSQGDIANANITWSKSVTLGYELVEEESGRSVRQPTDCEFSGNVILDSSMANVIADKMTVSFASYSLDVEDEKAEKARRMMAEKIVADGNVRMVRFMQQDEGDSESEKKISPATDSVDSDRLTITFKRDENDSVGPDIALAEGNVNAVSEGRSIQADSIELGFVKVEDTPSDQDQTEQAESRSDVADASKDVSLGTLAIQDKQETTTEVDSVSSAAADEDPEDENIPRMKFRPSYMIAQGEVFLSSELNRSETDKDEQNQSSDAADNKSGGAVVTDSTTGAAEDKAEDSRKVRIVTASGETLRSDLLSGVHKLNGKDQNTPARLSIDQRDQILGDTVVIRFTEQKTEDGKISQQLSSASIDGAGRGVFMLDRDIDGNQLIEPRPAIVRWQKRMAYHSNTDSIVLIGSVQLDSFDGLDFESDVPIKFDSQGDHLRSELMTIELAEFDQAESDENTDRNMVKSITAKGGAKLLRRWHDEDGFLRDRSQLSGPCIVLDQFSGQFIVLGEGSLLVEDYRAPQQNKADNKDEAGDQIAQNDDKDEDGSYDSGLESPSQTLFKWGKTLTIVHERDPDLALQILDDKADAVRGDQSEIATDAAAASAELPPPASWTAYMDGNVAMRHRSGSHIIRDESLNVRNDYEMPEGTVRQMDCRRMLVQFIERTEMVQEKGDKKPEEKSRVDLALFEAVGDVYMVDGDFEAQGGRIVYDTQFGQALVSGDEHGSATKNARVFKRGGVGGDIDTTSPLIKLKRKNGSYEITAIDSVGQGQR